MALHPRRAIRTARIIARHFGIPQTFDALTKLTHVEVEGIPGIGPVMRRELMYALARFGIEWLADTKAVAAKQNADGLRAQAARHRESARNCDALAERIEVRSGLANGQSSDWRGFTVEPL